MLLISTFFYTNYPLAACYVPYSCQYQNLEYDISIIVSEGLYYRINIIFFSDAAYRSASSGPVEYDLTINITIENTSYLTSK